MSFAGLIVLALPQMQGRKTPSYYKLTIEIVLSLVKSIFFTTFLDSLRNRMSLINDFLYSDISV